MSIEDLIKHVGSENISVQNLIQSLAGVKNRKLDSIVEFYTTCENGMDVANAAALGSKSKMTGLILWIPTDKLP